jgi:hypothetical protein
MKRFFIILSVSILMQACGNGSIPSGQKSSNLNATNIVESTTNTPKVERKISKAPTYYSVNSESSLYSEPSSKSPKLINKKATQALGEVYYMSIDKSCKVKILESSGDWSKIRVVDPNWLYDTHIGWVKTSVIDITDESDSATTDKFLENKDYQILYSKTQGTVTNYRVLVLWKNFNETKLNKLAKAIKEEKSPYSKCSISIYDSKDIVPLIEKYPIVGQEYVKLADHFVFELMFDGMTLYYPLKDSQYRIYGGTNPRK